MIPVVGPDLWQTLHPAPRQPGVVQGPTPTPSPPPLFVQPTPSGGGSGQPSVSSGPVRSTSGNDHRGGPTVGDGGGGEATPTTPTTTSPTSPPVTPGESVLVEDGTIVDFDASPVATAAASRGDPAKVFDVLFGPDNSYTENGRMWVVGDLSDCLTEARGSGKGHQAEIVFTSPELRDRKSVPVCMVTTGDQVLGLVVESQRSGGAAPYGVAYRRLGNL
ncbi:hypothetical protein ACPCHT_35230 [Nucisporomicrobium flavum]|uniref:hypothetical protein n=1 Tax=Nucisporomicrobium flavum TaxID=2785915 RepID=UPI003C2D6AC7